MAVGLRLGCVLCSAHRCSCGAVVSDRGVHGLSCRLAVGGLARHNAISDIIHRALGSAGVPAVLEPRGLTSSDERRPDGLTMIPWSERRCLTWDATVSDRFIGRVASEQDGACCRGCCRIRRGSQEPQICRFAAGCHFCTCCCRDTGPRFALLVPNSSRSSGVGSRPSPAIRVIPCSCFNEFPSRFRGAMLQLYWSL